MILVTGGTGLVGAHLLVDLLRDGHQVRALKRPSSNLAAVKRTFAYYAEDPAHFDRIEWVDGDICDIFSLEPHFQGIDRVYHAAALVSYDPRDAKALMAINVQGTANVVNLCLEHGIRKLAHVSSVAAIGRGRDGELLTENTKWEPFSNNYALSKHYAEREVWRAAEEGLDTVIVNPSLVLGPGAWGKSSTNVFRAVWKGLKFYTEGSGAFVDVRDVSRATIQLMDSTIVNERFLVVAENFAYRDFFNQIADGLGKPRARVKASRTMLALAWRLERVKSLFGGNTLGVTRETAQSAVAKTRYSNQKLTETLDFAFRPVDQSIKEICALFLEDVQSSGT